MKHWHSLLIISDMSHQRKIKLNPASVKGLKHLPSKKAAGHKKRTRKEEPFEIDVRLARQYKSKISLIKRKLKEEPVSPIPYDLKPMLASITEESFNSKDWQFEIKWDGYRALAYLANNSLQLRSRNNISFNQKYAAVYDALRQWPVNAVVDGEIVVLNEEGKSDFKALQDWQYVQNGDLVYFVFDILWLDGISLVNLPLTERQNILKQILPESGVIRFSESIDEYGADFYMIAKENGLEGIIAKQKNSTYKTGYRTQSWLKIKVEQRHEAVICGYTKKADTDREFSSLVLGIYVNEKLQFIGQVGTGFNMAMQTSLMKKMKPLVTKTCPFDETPVTTAPTVWVKPSLVCEVKYTELTSEGVMRHPSFQGLREDKSIADLNVETTGPGEHAPSLRKERNKKKKETGLLVDASKEQAIVTINDHELKLTNLKKLFWIKEGIDKGDMLNYYYQMAPYIMPYMKDRPQSLNRFPNGIHGESFYQKNMAGKVEKWVKTFRRFSESANEDKDFMICTDEAALIYMVNLGCIELNPWHSRVQTPHFPDWSVIDLDPGTISFDRVIETAMITKKVLDALQVPSFVKTSGSTGIHIYVPLGAKYNYEQSKQFAELVAHLVHEELPSFTSLIRNPEKRKDKIYIDYLQNRPIQTICSPYSIRPKPGATVSTPLHWGEVKKGLKMEQFTMHNIFERVQAEGDLFTGVLGTGIDLNKVLKALSGLVSS
jgi:bifunctional non-homologous end joining protein LigD